jgi:hypothetical protein
MKLQIARLAVPELEFGGAGYFQDPRLGLSQAGPFDIRFGAAHKTQIRVAVVGPAEAHGTVAAWLQRCRSEIPPVDLASKLLAFPGFEAVFRSELVAESGWYLGLDSNRINEAMGLRPYDGFERIVDLYARGIEEARREFQPDVVVCAISEAIEKRFWSVQRALSAREKSELLRASKQSISDQMELPFDWEPEENTEDLLRRDLRRALKARAMRIGVPIQLMRNSGTLDMKTNEEPAARAWNLSVGLYYKAGGIPWRIRARGPETCFVGITFHHLRTTRRSIVHSSLAQAFSTNGGGFALRGSTLEPDPEDRRRTPHLSKEQAHVLGARVLAEYTGRNGEPPKRVVLHKSSRFWQEEQEGFHLAFKDVPVVDLIALSPSSVRLVTHASYPPSRGTLLSVDEARHYLFTSGYLPELGTYPGPHIPIPVELTVHGESTFAQVREAAVDALGLGRLNWNTSDLRSSQPVTLGFARRVGGIMAEYGQLTDQDPDPSYRYYM